jgi:hypothetical protein
LTADIYNQTDNDDRNAPEEPTEGTCSSIIRTPFIDDMNVPGCLFFPGPSRGYVQTPGGSQAPRVFIVHEAGTVELVIKKCDRLLLLFVMFLYNISHT